jgi:Acetyltransferase (GNAT) domain
MDVQFVQVELSGIREAVAQHLESLPRPIDSFLEDHILASAHYRIRVDDAAAGFASIHHASLITQFCLTEPYKRYGQSVFQRLRKLETVSAAGCWYYNHLSKRTLERAGMVTQTRLLKLDY